MNLLFNLIVLNPLGMILSGIFHVVIGHMAMKVYYNQQ
jgi:hypothetical protein